MKRITTLIFSILLISCASKKVIIDTYGVDQEQYEKDYSQCEKIAADVSSGKTISKSATFGAIVGGALGAITGDFKQGAKIGAVQGTAGGAISSDREESTVLKNCMRNRGYKVLN